MTTFIERFEAVPGRPGLAVKDLIDVAGSPTTAGSRVVAEDATAALRDAACLLGARAAGATIVGKANLVELAFGTRGTNPWYGTPVNPVDPSLLPGGSSSGCAVAVATGEADVAYGTDTGGSIRIPSACCGTSGLKTSLGRVSTEGVWPLAPSLDTVGPMAVSVSGLVLGMSWLEPGFEIARYPARRVGRIRFGRASLPLAPGSDSQAAYRAVEEAIDAALAMGGFEVEEVGLPGWASAWEVGLGLLEAEAAQSNRHLLGDLDRLDPAVAERLRRGASVTPAGLIGSRAHRGRWRAELMAVLGGVELLALPTMIGFPPSLDDPGSFPLTFATGPVNLAGLPALSQPVPSARNDSLCRVPPSIQLVGPPGAEELLLATGLAIEAALDGSPPKGRR